MKQKMFLASIIFLSFFGITSCNNDDDNTSTTTGSIDSGNDPNFTIVANTDSGMTLFNRKVEVFGIDIYAVSGVSDTNLLHAANVMAQYLDNNEDGTIDNQAVLNKMLENQAFMVMWASESDLESIEMPDGREGQDLGNAETNSTYVSSGLTGRFDAALEEVLHIITHAGYAQVYPDVFGESAGSAIANAMDIARGGQFTSIPSSYPADAWYTYDDSTCAYDCQVTEYTYWALTSILGAQATADRLAEIENEWKLNTSELVQATDASVYAILTDTAYNLPTVLPDGTYRQ